MPAYRPAIERFVEKYEVVASGCWQWTASVNHHGYGDFAPGEGRSGAVRAHRWAYEHFVGPIPEGLQIDHLCRNRRCVNPAHMEPVTSATNTHRGMAPAAVNARKTHCSRAGHPLSGPNLLVDSKGKRRCRACRS
jgi:hypothetical protein